MNIYNTTPEHSKEYGLTSNNPLFVQITFDGNLDIQNIDKYAQENGHDLIFGHIQQKANPIKVKKLLEKNGYFTIEGNNDFYKYTNTFA